MWRRRTERGDLRGGIVNCMFIYLEVEASGFYEVGFPRKFIVIID